MRNLKKYQWCLIANSYAKEPRSRKGRRVCCYVRLSLHPFAREGDTYRAPEYNTGTPKHFDN